jgi:anti-sigma regulatory factor (Ser/Thr protein kinase)
MCVMTFPGRAESAGAARRWAASNLASCPNADAVVLVVSELVTNSVLHSRSAPAGTIEVRMAVCRGQWVGVTVRDEGPAQPAPFRDSTGAAVVSRPAVTKPGPMDESGRGLWLCGELAAEFGGDGQGLHWCRLPWRTSQAATPEPGPWGERWLAVMERAGWRCECSGQCGRAGHRCPAGHAPGYPLHVVPAIPAGEASAAALPASALIALCSSCRTGSDRRAARQADADAPEPDALFVSPSVKELHGPR